MSARLVEVLRSVAAMHDLIEPTRDGNRPWRCSCGIEFKSGWTSCLDHLDHLADEQAKGVAAWLGGDEVREEIVRASMEAEFPPRMSHLHRAHIYATAGIDAIRGLAGTDTEESK